MASSLSRLLLYSIQFILFYYVQCTVFKDGDKVTLYVNKVGPYWNPHETYHYFTMPLCRPDKVEHKSLTLGEVLDGDRMAMSLYEIGFKVDIDSKELCKKPIAESDLHKLIHAIEDLYYFEFVMDELPMRGFIGHLDESGFLPHSHQVFLYTHHHFTIEYNGNQVVSVNITTQEQTPVNLLELKPPVDIVFTYSVKWLQTSVKYEDRGKLQHRSSFFPKALEIHWLSVINSVVLVFLLMGFVVIILTRILNRDFRSFSIHDDEAERFEEDDEIGWKVIHTDVFRYPNNKLLLCAILGVGTQFLTLLGGILSMALCGVFNVHRHGAINAAAILLYALTSCISGYVSGRFYRQMEGQRWVWNINLTACLFTVPFFFTWSVINSVAWAWGSTQALPFTTIVILMLIWLCVGYPLTVIGGIFGKNWAGNFNAPCRTKNIAREIPPLPLYRSQFAYMLVGGFLPFSAISVELYYIFATLWGRQSYTLYGILMLVFIILLSVTACVSVALTYFQLSSEDHRWWWRSVISSGSTGLFVFAYALFYYFDRSNMSGTLQSLQFFGYTVLTCYVFFLMLGTVGFVASLKFVRYIYVYIKTD